MNFELTSTTFEAAYLALAQEYNIVPYVESDQQTMTITKNALRRQLMYVKRRYTYDEYYKRFTADEKIDLELAADTKMTINDFYIMVYMQILNIPTDVHEVFDLATICYLDNVYYTYEFYLIFIYAMLLEIDDDLEIKKGKKIMDNLSDALFFCSDIRAKGIIGRFEPNMRLAFAFEHIRSHFREYGTHEDFLRSVLYVLDHGKTVLQRC